MTRLTKLCIATLLLWSLIALPMWMSLSQDGIQINPLPQKNTIKQNIPEKQTYSLNVITPNTNYLTSIAKPVENKYNPSSKVLPFGFLANLKPGPSQVDAWGCVRWCCMPVCPGDIVIDFLNKVEEALKLLEKIKFFDLIEKVIHAVQKFEQLIDKFLGMIDKLMSKLEEFLNKIMEIPNMLMTKGMELLDKVTQLDLGAIAQRRKDLLGNRNGDGIGNTGGQGGKGSTTGCNENPGAPGCISSTVPLFTAKAAYADPVSDDNSSGGGDVRLDIPSYSGGLPVSESATATAVNELLREQHPINSMMQEMDLPQGGMSDNIQNVFASLLQTNIASGLIGAGAAWNAGTENLYDAQLKMILIDVQHRQMQKIIDKLLKDMPDEPDIGDHSTSSEGEAYKAIYDYLSTRLGYHSRITQVQIFTHQTLAYRAKVFSFIANGRIPRYGSQIEAQLDAYHAVYAREERRFKSGATN